MKILIISQYFWPENFRINDLVAGLVERGHEVSVLTGIPNYPEGSFYSGYGILGPYSENFSGATVKRVPMTPRGKQKALFLALNYLSFSTFACLWSLFRCRDKYDAVFVWCMSPVTVTLSGLVIKGIRGIPVYNWIADLWPDTLRAAGTLRPGRIMSLVGKLSSFIYRKCDLNLIASEGYRSRLIEMGVEPEKITYWPFWAEAVYSEPLDVEKTVPISEITGFKLLFAGNIGRMQGFDTIVKAAEILKDKGDIHWIILGDGSEKAWLEQEARARGLGDNFHFLGRCPIEDVRYYAAEADAMLVSLRKDPLFAITVPGKLQSCMALGRPIIASIDGEAADIIHASKGGRVAQADDAEALADAVLSIECLSSEERSQMGRNARAYFMDNFEREKLFSKLEVILSGTNRDGWTPDAHEARDH